MNDDRLEMLDCKVAHADGFDCTRVAKSEHRLPCVHHRSIRIDCDFVRLVRPSGELVATSDECDGPVNEIQVEVRGTKLLKRGVELPLNLRCMVGVIPEFRGDEELLAPNHGR
jgi:hypothetical protein